MYSFLFSLFPEILSHDVSVACLPCILVPWLYPFYLMCVYNVGISLCSVPGHCLPCSSDWVSLSPSVALVRFFFYVAYVYFCLVSQFCVLQNTDSLFLCLFASSPSDLLFCALLPSGDSVDTIIKTLVQLSLSEFCIWAHSVFWSWQVIIIIIAGHILTPASSAWSNFCFYYFYLF